jgi:DNA-binding Xre family transcriptional regulator
VIHRHVEVPEGTPVERWPSPALVDVLERGDLADWQPLAAAVAREPSGPLAERLLQLVDAYPAYGTSPLWRAWIDRCRARAEGPLPAAAAPLPALRRRRGLTQVELARRMGLSQSDLSKLERRTDVRVSTLAAVATALGGRLRLVLDLGGETVEIRLPGRRRRAARGRKPRRKAGR